MTTPRMHNGRPLHHLGRGYAVLADRAGAELTTRQPGEVWLGFEHHAEVKILFMPDSTDADGALHFAGHGMATSVDVVLEDDGVVLTYPLRSRCHDGDDVAFHWDDALGVMA